jgi:type VI secretion system secreted protein VgrG
MLYKDIKVGEDFSTSVGQNKTTTVTDDETRDVGKNFVLRAGDSITLRVGKSVLVMKKDGSVTINGKNIDVVGTKHVGVESRRIDLN